MNAPTKSQNESRSSTGGDQVSHPSHYTQHAIEPLQVIEDWDLGFHAGNALKYIARYRYKGTPAQDLRKAAFYLTRLADQIEKETAPAPPARPTLCRCGRMSDECECRPCNCNRDRQPPAGTICHRCRGVVG